MGEFTQAVLPKRRTLPDGETSVRPLPWLGWLGFLLALGTLGLVITETVREARGSGSLWRDPFLVWSVPYAAALALGWWRMRPAIVAVPAYYASALGFLLQGGVYAWWWWQHVFGRASDLLTVGSADAVSDLRLDLMIICALLVFFAGPVMATIAMITVRRPVAMLCAQLGGPLGLILLGEF